MNTRTIMVFPKFENIAIINDIRNKFDPLASLVEPHITIVFPFKSYLRADEIEGWLKIALKDFQKFELELCGVSKTSSSYGNYLSLNIQKGCENFIKLNQLLYGDVLSEYKSSITYNPHLTLWKLSSVEQLDEAYLVVEKMDTRFIAIIDTIAVELIGENQKSIIEIEFKMQ